MPQIKPSTDLPWSISTAALALLLQATGAVAAPPSVSSLPREVRGYVEGLDEMCRRVGGMPAESPRLVRAVDLTGDGRLDYVVDSGGYVCTNALSVTSAGHDGAAVSIFVGRPAGTAALAYEGFSHGVNVTRLRGSPRIHLIVGARACGQPAGPRPFSDWWFCSRRLVWNARNRRFVFAPISEARRIDRRVR